MALTKAYEVPIVEPVIITVVDEASPPPVNNAGDKDDSSCGVPPNASRSIRAVSLSVYVRTSTWEILSISNPKQPINA